MLFIDALELAELPNPMAAFLTTDHIMSLKFFSRLFIDSARRNSQRFGLHSCCYQAKFGNNWCRYLFVFAFLLLSQIVVSLLFCVFNFMWFN